MCSTKFRYELNAVSPLCSTSGSLKLPGSITETILRPLLSPHLVPSLPVGPAETDGADMMRLLAVSSSVVADFTAGAELIPCDCVFFGGAESRFTQIVNRVPVTACFAHKFFPFLKCLNLFFKF